MRTSRFYGWNVVATAFVVAIFGWGVGFYGPPVFLKAVQDLRGWPVALVSAAITVHFLMGALAVANTPRLYRRFGLARVTAAGAAMSRSRRHGMGIRRCTVATVSRHVVQRRRVGRFGTGRDQSDGLALELT